MKPKKTEEKELKILGKTKLFFMDLFKMPAKNGQRRFIKNIFTGKWEWTDGTALYKDTTLEELQPPETVPETPEANMETLIAAEEIATPTEMKPIPNIVYSGMAFEPYMENRWIFEFPDIESFLFQNLVSVSEGETLAEVILVINQQLEDKLEELRANSSNTRKRKLGQHATLKMLDATGVVLCSYLYKNIEVINVDMFNNLSYDRDGISTARIFFKHEPRVKILPCMDLLPVEEKPKRKYVKKAVKKVVKKAPKKAPKKVVKRTNKK